MGRFVVHNVLMMGPPGADKTLLARALLGILPKMSIDEALDVTRIYSVANQLPPETPLGESSATVRERVETARDRQRVRFDGGARHLEGAGHISCAQVLRPR